jgi:hypothetical protein
MLPWRSEEHSLSSGSSDTQPPQQQPPAAGVHVVSVRKRSGKVISMLDVDPASEAFAATRVRGLADLARVIKEDYRMPVPHLRPVFRPSLSLLRP